MVYTSFSLLNTSQSLYHCISLHMNCSLCSSWSVSLLSSNVKLMNSALINSKHDNCMHQQWNEQFSFENSDWCKACTHDAIERYTLQLSITNSSDTIFFCFCLMECLMYSVGLQKKSTFKRLVYIQEKTNQICLEIRWNTAESTSMNASKAGELYHTTDRSLEKREPHVASWIMDLVYFAKRKKKKSQNQRITCMILSNLQLLGKYSMLQ